MAELATAAVGAVIGGLIGGVPGAMYGAQIGFTIGAIAFAEDQVAQGPKIGEVAKQFSQEGVPRPIVFGTARPIGGNIIYAGAPDIVEKKKKVASNPLGSDQYVEYEEVYRTYALRICEGPVTGVSRVWRNNELVYDARPPVGETQAKNNAKFLETATFYTGTYQQMPDPSLQSEFGVDEVPAHRGTCYMVQNYEDLTDLRGAIPQYIFEVGHGQTHLLAIAHTGNDGYGVVNEFAWTLDTAYPGVDALSASAVESVDFSPDSRYLALGFQGGNRLAVVEVSSKAVVAGTPALPGTAHILRFSPDGSYLAIGHSDGLGSQALTVLRTSDWSSITGLPVLTGAVHSLAFSPDGQYLALGGILGDYWLEVLRVSDWSLEPGMFGQDATPFGPTSVVRGLAFSPDSRQLAVGGPCIVDNQGSEDAEGWCILGIDDWRPIGGTISLDADLVGQVQSLDWHPSTDRVAIGMSVSPWILVMDRAITEAWLPAAGVSDLGVYPPNSAVHGVRFSDDGEYLAVGYDTQAGGNGVDLFKADTLDYVDGFTWGPATMGRDFAFTR